MTGDVVRGVQERNAAQRQVDAVMGRKQVSYWTAFGTPFDDHDRTFHTRRELISPDAAAPDNEVTNGIIHVAVQAYGDVPDNLFVLVAARERDVAIDAWNRLVTALTPNPLLHAFYAHLTAIRSEESSTPIRLVPESGE